MSDAGLCSTCVHCRVIRARHSTFYLCRLSVTDERFPKYPRLPVVRCIGYSPAESPNNQGSADVPDDAG